MKGPTDNAYRAPVHGAALAAAGAGARPRHAPSESEAHLRTVNELAGALLPPTRLDEILWVVARTAISRLGFDDCVIYLLDDARSVLVQKAAYGPKNPVAEEILDPIEIAVGEGIVGSVAATARPELVADTRLDPRYILDDEMRLSELAVPIVHQGEVIGVIDSEHAQADFYTASHLEILTTIASMASTKIASALTIERLNDTVRQLEATERALREGELRYRMLYEQHPSMFFTVDADGTVLSANSFAAQSLGYTLDELVGCRLQDLSTVGERHAVIEGVARCVQAPGEIQRWESCRLRGDGRRVWVRETAHLVALDDGAEPSILVVSEDITEAYKLARELEYEASHDALTGLHNRREFELRLRDAINDARRTRTGHALCYLDLDQFKVINDTAGHVAGDQLLRQLAAAFRQRVRESDFIARLGGDEFGVIIKHADVGQATRLAYSLLEVAGASRFHWEGQLFRYGVSIGVVPITGAEHDLSAVLAAADAACYAAKEAGRNRVHVFSPHDEELRRRHQEMSWTVLLRQAIEGNQFQLYHEPIVATGDARRVPVMAEVLLRLSLPDGRVAMAETFMPAAERYGLAMEIDRWVIHNALGWLARHAGTLNELELFCINISGISLGDAGFADFVLGELRDTALDPARVCFEVTETAAIADLYNARAFISRLKDVGCRFALDDFGSGLSSFAYLKGLPVDFLKIDGAFVRDLADDHVDREMVRAIAGIARLLGKRTVAEYVETDAALDAVRGIGIDFAQGKLLGGPRPLSALVAPQRRLA